MRCRSGASRTILLFHIISGSPQALYSLVWWEVPLGCIALGGFLFLQEQIKTSSSSLSLPAAGSHCPAREDSAPHCGTAIWDHVSSNSIPPYLRTIAPTSSRQPTVPATRCDCKLCGGSASILGTSVYRRSKWGRRIVRRPKRAKSDCPTTGDRGARE